MKKICIIPLLLVVLIVIVLVFFTNNENNESVGSTISATGPTQVVIGGKTIDIEIADTDSKRRLGLSGRESLDKDAGMLFIFENEGNHGFWMKDMLFPIDILWINSVFEVVHIEKSVSPDSYPLVFKPDVPAIYVLEVNSGVSDELGIVVGDVIGVKNL